MKERRLWPTRRTTDEANVQLAWGLVQGVALGIVIVTVFAVIDALT